MAEGARRMRFAGQRIVFVALSVFLLIYASARAGFPLPEVVWPIVVALGCFGSMMWLAGWIVEGFDKRTS